MSRSRTSLSISQRIAALREKEPSDTPTRDTWQTTDMRHHDKHQIPVYSSLNLHTIVTSSVS
jgi:hypothetical protein